LKPAGLEYARFVVEILGFAGLIVTLIFARNSLVATEETVRASNGQLQAAYNQLNETRYESVYQQQLSLWQLAADHPELAPYLVGGEKPPPTPASENLNDGQTTDDQNKRAARDSAISNALDFYSYVFEQLVPRHDDQTPIAHALEVSPQDPPPVGLSQNEWEGWSTWASVIVAGFHGAPGMCDLLNEQQPDGAYFYEHAFRGAVSEAVPNCVK
jgi:hypothetical protein